MGDKGLQSFLVNEVQTLTTGRQYWSNVINYPMTDEISVLYTTSEGEVKQEIVISEITAQLKNSLTISGSEGYLGFSETMKLPSGYYLSSDGVALSNVNLFETDKGLLIHNEIGKVVGSIMEPVVLDSAEDKEQELDNGITYFLTIDETGSNIEFITAVDKTWLLSGYIIPWQSTQLYLQSRSICISM